VAGVHATDDRAGATIDYQLDEADRGVKRIQCPVLVLWSPEGYLPKWYDVLSIWRDWANDVRGEAIDGSHYLAEENPEATYRALYGFFRSE
jgi:haloacetate dehalogenase